LDVVAETSYGDDDLQPVRDPSRGGGEDQAGDPADGFLRPSVG
jgi:hypothetical protein